MKKLEITGSNQRVHTQTSRNQLKLAGITQSMSPLIPVRWSNWKWVSEVTVDSKDDLVPIRMKVKLLLTSETRILTGLRSQNIRVLVFIQPFTAAETAEPWRVNMLTLKCVRLAGKVLINKPQPGIDKKKHLERLNELVKSESVREWLVVKGVGSWDHTPQCVQLSSISVKLCWEKIWDSR